jgi:hydrogenase maturation protease
MRHVIGFGNPLHGDDGFAAAVCQRLLTMPLASDVRVFEVGTRGLDALGLLKDCDEAILIDAAMPAGTPGRVSNPSPQEVQAEAGLSFHCAGVGYLLRAVAALEEVLPRIRIISAEAQMCEPFSMRLSAPMATAVEQVVSKLQLELLE